MGALREAFEESDIPIIVDEHDWATLPESFHREIQRNYLPFVGAVRKTLECTESPAL